MCLWSRHGAVALLCALFLIYSVIVYSYGTEVQTGVPYSAAAARGHDLFQANNCIACHQFYGLGGYMGPDLTNVISHPDKGPDYVRGFIQFGTDKMPNFNFSDTQIDDFVAFLTFVDAAGPYPPKNPSLTWYGTFKESTTEGSARHAGALQRGNDYE